MAKRSDNDALIAAMLELHAPPPPPGFRTHVELEQILGKSESVVRKMLEKLGDKVEKRRASVRTRGGRLIQSTVYKLKSGG